VASSLAEAYELVYSTLSDPGSGYPEAGGAAGVKHTPAQVRTILGVLQ
jgi:conserved oligomeric Golgi complex subunit 6